MDSDIVLAKMESLNRCLTRIEEKKPQTLKELEKNYDLQDILVLNLERAVQQMVDIALHILIDYKKTRPENMAMVFADLAESNVLTSELASRLAKAVGFRNIAVHEYRKLDWNIVWNVVHERLDDFKSFGKVVLGLLEKNGDS